VKPCVACGARGARFCSSCGAALGSELLAQRKIATVLFCDVVGFTAAVERADAESQWQIMLGYFEQARSAIERHGGTVEKFIGDAVVGVFGVPVAQEDAALRAVRAAVDIDRQVAALNPELERRYGAGIQLRIGVNTGEVVAGRDPVSGGSMVIADAVNVAARLQQAADPGEIVLGDQTHHLLREQVVAEPLARIEAKGQVASPARIPPPATRARPAEVRHGPCDSARRSSCGARSPDRRLPLGGGRAALPDGDGDRRPRRGEVAAR
jgi:class 3 adenylate cyclase